ncbi:uncharacterized protein LOC128956250 [Oppia nitens]|uniref:uncharacterized protein LOC128955040 n=1 Tax=Oppia nitens TaxID=1686743 RepID=UPI0023DB0E56|nr:uncharacterized protein LOC128955040 [Oppia nitens]XP_054156651.1 uncharacterized protein LOC128955044 [Oppia nitens]XP_054156652.1 uncharacterized protein LOC128955045 [Oppia nitens]XP_054156656.1 uncharacterized protein LOC128955050 [Oppia nitens]XP_054156684.1 uncharacterized protein LOC128955072 [Oppia nitens]XP_054157917.1 uncharacterized protein LOC128956250 [Oppia nitens]
MAYNKCQTNSNNNRNQLLLLSSNGKWFQTNWFKSLPNRWPTIRSVYTINDDIDIDSVKFQCDQSVVQIMIPSLMDNQKIVGNGSGFRLKAMEMSIITNAHVVQGSHLIQLIMYFDGWLELLLPASVVYCEPHRDLALIQLMNPRKDYFRAQPFDTKTTDIFGKPVASIGPTQTAGEKSCQSGIIQTTGITVRQQQCGQSGHIYPSFIDDNRCPLVQHSAPILHGYSGGPALTSEANVIGVQLMVSLIQDFAFAITCTDILDFIENSKRYANSLNVRQLNRTVGYTLRPGLKLGLIIFNTIDDNNTDLIIDNTLPESVNYKFIGHQISDTNIQQIANKLNGLTRDNNIIALTMRSMADTTNQSELMSMTAIDYTQQNLPIIF